MTIDEAALVTGQEDDSLGLLDGLAEPAGGEVDLAAQTLGLVVAEPVLQQRGVEWGRAQAVETVALASVDHGEFTGQREDGALAGGVGELRCGRADEGDDACSVDDTSLGLLVAAEGEHGVLAAIPDALDVDVHGQVPDVLRSADGVVIARVHDARVVEDDIETAGGVDGVDHGLHLSLLGDVAERRGNGRRGHELQDLGLGLLEGWRGDVGQEHCGALASKEDGGLETNATVGGEAAVSEGVTTKKRGIARDANRYCEELTQQHR